MSASMPTLKLPTSMKGNSSLLSSSAARKNRQATKEMIDQLNKSHVYPKPVVTQVSASATVWPAEAYHQEYAETHPDAPYIVINDAPKVANLRKQFPELYTDKLAAHE